VRAVRATSLEDFAGALRDGFAEAGPWLIQVDL
jgi:hypothetical protein